MSAYRIRSLAKFSICILIGAAFSSVVAFAWTGPTGTAPANNVAAPINVGATSQVKSGGLSVNSLVVFGNTLLSGFGAGVGRYLNFDYTAGGTSGTGASGYGIRDNGAGTLEFKNLGGAWENRNNLTGNLTVSGNVTAAGYFHSSDARLKDNIATVDGADIISKLRGVSFNWKKDGTPSVGVIAQEVETVMPSAVHTDAQGMKSVDYDQLIGPLIEAVKTLDQKVEAQDAEIKTLEAPRN